MNLQETKLKLDFKIFTKFLSDIKKINFTNIVYIKP